MNSGEQPADEVPTASAPEASVESAASPPATAPETVPEVASGPTPSRSAPPKPTQRNKAPLPRLGRGPLAARGLGVAKPASPAVSTEQLEARDKRDGGKRGGKSNQPRKGGPGVTGTRGNQARPAATSGTQLPTNVAPGSIVSPAFSPSSLSGADLSGAGLSATAAGEGNDEAFDPRIQPKLQKSHPRPRLAGEKTPAPEVVPATPRQGKIPVPSVRTGLSDDLQAELEASLAGSDFEAFLGGSAGLPDRREPLAEGARVHAQVIKMHDDTVFVSLGGPDQGTVPAEQFEGAEPTAGMNVEVLIRGFSREDGLYACVLPGQAMEVSDWEDIQEGSIVEATVTGHNAGGLELTVGNIRAFMPISQVTEYRVEDLSEFVDQKMICLVNEANERRGNLVLSRRAILERERQEKRAEQLEQMEVGDIMEGTVRSVRDFGAFVDLGGLDGMIHVSKLSWERIKHPSEVIEEGQRVKVKVDKVDKQTGKISLSYRDLLENPWDVAESSFAIGSVHKGVVTRIAAFGCFVRLTAGVEGLVHISELANHRVSKISAFVNEGDTVEVKVLTFDRGSQKIALSMKAAQAKAVDPGTAPEEEEDEPVRELAVKGHGGPLRGGNDRDAGGERFGLRW